MITPNKFRSCSYWCLEEKRKIIVRYLMSNVYRLFCGTVAGGVWAQFKPNIVFLLCKGEQSWLMFISEDVKYFRVCPFHEFKLQFQFRMSFFWFHVCFNSFFFHNHKKVIVMKRFSDTDLDGKSNNCYFMMNCLNFSFLFRYRSWSQSFRCSLLILRSAK